MFKKSMLVMSALSIVAVPAASEARHYSGYDDNDGYSQYDAGRYEQQQQYYAQQGYYPQRPYAYNNRYYGRSYGYRQHRCSGTTGTIIGAGAGALLGRSLGRGSGYYHEHSGTTGTILGAALGALVGHEVGKATC